MHRWLRGGLCPIAALAGILALPPAATAQEMSVSVSLTLQNQSGSARYIDPPSGRFLWVDSGGATSAVSTGRVPYSLTVDAKDYFNEVVFSGSPAADSIYEVHPAGPNGNRLSAVQCRITVQPLVINTPGGSGFGIARAVKPGCRAQSDTAGCSIAGGNVAGGGCYLTATIHPIN